MQRLFTSGSRQAPDPYDQYLEQHNFYRKHTARDSSCLFRVISEQMYDTQIHHLDIRKQCVQYMRKHRNFFQNLVVRDIDEYLDDLAKPKTFGSLVELEALGFMFQRNVLLYQPYDLGNLYSNRSYFYKVFRVFYSPERHFDSVFPCEYIKDIAICQSICYEILYKDLFKLPDVNYAVEKMLHGGAYESSESRFDYSEDGFASRVYLSSGRFFDLDSAKETLCILENYKFCHFHYANFPRFTEELQLELRNNSSNSDSGENSNTMLNRTFESLLPDKYVSCVRQLLREGITPFPYKVAKALDPSMYRNIEFDSWNETRKEQRLANWYNGDANFKVGAKCHVRLRKSENDLYTCHIQEMSVDKGYCVVFIEQLGEKRMVPYESLTPLPPDQFKPWTLPYRMQRHMRMPRHYNFHQGKFGGSYSYGNGSNVDLCTPIGSIKSADNWEDYNDKMPTNNMSRAFIHPWYHNKEGCYYRLKQFTSLDHFQPPTMDYCTLPLSFEYKHVKQGSAGGTQANENQTKIQEAIESGPQNGGGNESRSFADLTIKTENTTDEDNNGNATLTEMNDSNLTALTSNGNEEETLVAGFENLSMEPAMAPITGTYMSDGCCYFGTYSTAPYFGPMDEYYPAPGYGYEYPGPTGPVYYMYPSQPANFSYAATSNMYIPATAGGAPAMSMMPAAYPGLPGHPSGGVMATASPATAGAPLPSPYVHSSQSAPSAATHFGAGNNPLYNTVFSVPPALSTPNMQSIPTTSSSGYHSPAIRNRFNSHGFIHNNGSTPTNGRINMEARKSVKPNGLDLPQDVNTLRYFYNLGVDYHKLVSHKNRNENENKNDQQQQYHHQPQQQHQYNYHSQKDKERLDENGNSHEMVKHDANNNNNNYMNYNKNSYNSGSGGGGGGGGNGPGGPRRFNQRFFGSNRLDRLNIQRGGSAPNTSGGGNGGGGGGGNGHMNHQGNFIANRQHQQQNDYNHNVIPKGSYYPKSSGGGGGGNSASTPNSSRPHGGAAGNGAGGNGQRSGLSESSTPHGSSNGNDHLPRQSPLLADPHPGNGPSPGQNGYEQIGDGHMPGHNLYSGPPPSTPSSLLPPFANGMFIPMGPPPPYGMFPPNGPPPPPNPQAVGGAQNPGGPNGAFLQPPPTPTGSQSHYNAVQYSQMPPPTPSSGGLLTANGMTCPAPIINGNNTLYVTTPIGSDASDGEGNGNGNGGQAFYQPMAYPPPGPPPNGAIPFFYPTMGGPNMPNNGAMIMNGSSQNPGAVYWSQPATTTPAAAASHSGDSTYAHQKIANNDNPNPPTSNNSGSSNKRNNNFSKATASSK